MTRTAHDGVWRWFCSNCRWWGEPVEPTLLQEFGDMRRCMCPQSGIVGIDHDRMQDERTGEVATRPDFSCINHSQLFQPPKTFMEHPVVVASEDSEKERLRRTPGTLSYDQALRDEMYQKMATKKERNRQ